MVNYLVETVSAFLPFALRRLIMSLPALVAIRARKPCFLARLRVLGWYVRFGIFVNLKYHYTTIRRENLQVFKKELKWLIHKPLTGYTQCGLLVDKFDCVILDFYTTSFYKIF